MIKEFKDFLMRGNLVELAVAFVMGLAFAALVPAHAESPQAAYAARRLDEVTKPSRYVLAVDPGLGAESFTLVTKGGRTHITGGDGRGLVYGALAVREQLLNRLPLNRLPATVQRPALAFRGIKFNTPWDTYRPSSALDQHVDTVRDLKFWEAFLDMILAGKVGEVA